MELLRRLQLDASSELEIQRIYRPNRSQAIGILAVYHQAFEPEQRVADSSLLGTIDETPQSSRHAFLIARLGEAIAGFAYTLFFPSFRMAHMMYLGVAKQHTGRGVGRALFEETVAVTRQLAAPPHWLTLEALRPEAAADEAERSRRQASVDFLRKMGGSLIYADFQAPPLGPGCRVLPYWIVARPVADPKVFPELVPDALRVIYQAVYGLPETHALVEHCLETYRPSSAP